MPPTTMTTPTVIALTQAVGAGTLLCDVCRSPGPDQAETNIVTFRAVGRCPHCGLCLPIHVAVRRGTEPAIHHAAVGGERCPDCGVALAPDAAEYLGVAGPGWPWVPATALSASDLYHALTLRQPQRSPGAAHDRH